MTYRVFPEQFYIDKFKVKLTDGEKILLNYLKILFEHPNYRERQFEIYVQSNLFFGKPDFIIIEPGYSMWIIEVKDYRRNTYKITVSNKKDCWQLSDQTIISSPIEQVEDYKRKIIDYAGPSFETTTRLNKNKFALSIRTAVFFYHLLPEDFSREPNYTKLLFPSTFIDFQSDGVAEDFFKQIWKTNNRMNADEYREILSIINPGDNGKNEPLPKFTGKYKELCQSNDKHQKIKGVAGTGKTTVLAKRAVNASRRYPQNEILVTCFNITMCNYLKDKIVAEGGKNLNELGINIRHFHSLYHWKKQNDGSFVESGKKDDKKYGAIFIDEGQDFEFRWFNYLIRDYILGEEREFVVFADENQNIYDRLTDSQKDEFETTRQLPKTPIRGRWNVLDKVYRTTSNEIVTMLNHFSRDILQDKNVVMDMQLTLSEEDKTFTSFNLTDNRNDEGLFKAIELQIDSFIKNGAAINDITILCTNKFFFRDIEFNLREKTISNNLFLETTTTFKPKCSKSDNYGSKESESKADRPYKMRFFRNNGPIKLSTVHSFKGWESPYIILIISPSDQNNLKHDYLVYTGLSRAKKKLSVINFNSNYTAFFNQFK